MRQALSRVWRGFVFTTIVLPIVVSPAAAALEPPEVNTNTKLALYPRPKPFWSLPSGPTYGFVTIEETRSPDVIVTRVGSFSTRGPELALPQSLRASGAPNGAAYFLVQLTPDAAAPARLPESLRTLAASGAGFLDYVPNNAYVVQVDRAALRKLASSDLVQFVQPYHPAYKIAPDLGTAPLPNPEKAASSVYTLAITGFRGVTASALSGAVAGLGATVTLAEDHDYGPFVVAELSRDQVLPLARIEGVRTIDENLPVFAQGEEASWNVIEGTYQLQSLPALYQAGVNGSGRYRKDVDNPPLSAANPPVAGPEDVDWNGNRVIDNAAQVVANTDTGMSLNSGAFSETAFSTGWNSNGGAAGPNVPRYGDGLTNRNHRKVAWYKVAPGGFGSGDLQDCDASHGTSSNLAGNASSGPFQADGLDWTGDGTVDDYGDPDFGDTCGPGFCAVCGMSPTRYRLDAPAYGARLVFQDVSSMCPEPASFNFGDYGVLLGDARAKGARIHNYPFGSGGGPGTPTAYNAAAASIDGYLTTDPGRDYMLFIAAGNSGSVSSGTGGHGTARSLANEASSKNAIAIGGDLSGTTASLRSRAAFSSVGPAPNGVVCAAQTAVRPAPSNCGRVKPDLMAPAQDGGGIGLAEHYGCVGGGQMGTPGCTFSGCPVGGNSGTSFASALVASAGVLVRDYFVQGLFPDGTSGNAGNDTDRAPKVSGALLKAMLAGSADDLTGSNLHPLYGHRYNHEAGYGFIDLKNVLPLAIDPQSPPTLLVHDAGCAAGDSCPSNLPLPAALGTGASATAEFEVFDTRRRMSAALAWADPVDGLAAGALVNDLDLELRWCGADRNCATSAGDVVYYGNVFTEDPNDDGIEDQNLDGTPGLTPTGSPGHWRSEGSWSLSNRGDPGAFVVEAARDNRNNIEAVFLSPDPEADGTDSAHDADNQVRVGRWQVKVRHGAAGPDAQTYALVVAGGVRRAGLLTASFDANKNLFEWSPLEASARYDVATKQGLGTAVGSATAWLGPGGNFDTFSCRQSAILCTDTDSDIKCEYATASDGIPATGTLDLWLVRQDAGSWDEPGSVTLVSPFVSRDTRMIDDGSAVCP